MTAEASITVQEPELSCPEGIQDLAQLELDRYCAGLQERFPGPTLTILVVSADPETGDSTEPRAHRMQFEGMDARQARRSVSLLKRSLNASAEILIWTSNRRVVCQISQQGSTQLLSISIEGTSGHFEFGDPEPYEEASQND